MRWLGWIATTMAAFFGIEWGVPESPPGQPEREAVISASAATIEAALREGERMAENEFYDDARSLVSAIERTMPCVSAIE